MLVTQRIKSLLLAHRAFFIVVQLQLSPFSLYCSPLPCPSPPHIQSSPTLVWSMSPLYLFLDLALPLLFPFIHLPSPLVTVSLFFISMSLVVFCSLVHFVDYVPLISQVIWYLSFTTRLISLSIILYSSILAVAKCRSSFFLSDA